MINVNVVGSGVISLSIALELALEGYKVQVITRDPRQASSWIAGGMLAPFSEGLEGPIFDFSYESLKTYKDFVKKVEDVSKIKIDLWMEGIYRIVLKGEDFLLKKAQEYLKTYAVEIDLEPHRTKPYLSQHVDGIIHYLEEGWVDTYSLMSALFKALERLCVKVIVDSVVKVEKLESRIERLVGISNAYVSDFYVIANGAWARELLDIPIYPVKGQALKINGRVVDNVHYSNVSYIIPRRHYTYIGATSEKNDFTMSITVGGLLSLIEGMVKVIPSLQGMEVIEALSGFRPCTHDDLPVFEIGENYLFAGGHCRNGILHAPITSSMAKDFIHKKLISKYMELFSSRRFSFAV